MLSWEIFTGVKKMMMVGKLGVVEFLGVVSVFFIFMYLCCAIIK